MFSFLNVQSLNANAFLNDLCVFSGGARSYNQRFINHVLFTATLKQWRITIYVNTAQVLNDFTEMLHHFFAISLSLSSRTWWLLYNKKPICSNRNWWIIAQSGVFVTGCHGPWVSHKEVNAIFVISWIVCSSELVPCVWVSKTINAARWKSESLI